VPHDFALIGAAGYIAPRHMKAIRDTGNRLVAAVDPSDNVGVLDSYFPGCRFFTEVERFDRHVEKLRRNPDLSPVSYVSICSPNYLHDAHTRLALRVGASAICEKPLVISPWNLDQLAEIEADSPGRVYTVLQLRLLPSLIELKKRIDATPAGEVVDVDLTYITRRGPWYHVSWKGRPERSGTLAMNIGIHFFDLLQWLFGPSVENHVHLRELDKFAGTLRLEKARVRWFLSIDAADLPASVADAGGYAYRSITLDGTEMEFSTGFTDLHTRVYEDILAGRGYGLEEARAAIALVHDVRNVELSTPAGAPHPSLERHL